MRNKIKNVVGTISTKARMLLNLSLNDYKQKYASSALGIVWGFIPSLMTVVIYWFVFTVGFRMNDSSEPYLIWLLSGLIPWFFLSEALVGITNCFLEYSYLVKKVVFDIKMLPLVKLSSSLINHVFFLVILFYALLGYGYLPTLAYAQILYYMVCLTVFTAALGKITAILNVLFRDVANIVSVILQFGVWTLPILWRAEMFSPSILNVLKINPLFYVVQGYRDSLLYGTGVLSHGWYNLYFWVITGVLLWVGDSLLKKLQGQFSDLL